MTSVNMPSEFESEGREFSLVEDKGINSRPKEEGESSCENKNDSFMIEDKSYNQYEGDSEHLAGKESQHCGDQEQRTLIFKYL